MKYISEEQLREKGRFYMPDSVLQEFMSKECTELDELTVTKLRPMGEAPRDGTEILVANILGFFKSVYWSAEYKVFVQENNCTFYEDKLRGWIPMPQYKPEE